MRLNLDLARAILIKVADGPANQPMRGELAVEGSTQDEVFEHVALLIEAGLLDAQVIKASGGRIIATTINRLTWGGHEFLAKAREDGLWAKAKSVVASKGSALTVEILSGVLTSLAKQAAGLPD